jgi:hypothetical protein
VTAVATAAPGLTIVAVNFQYLTAGSSQWVTFDTSMTAPYSGAFFPDAFNIGSGNVQIRAQAVDSNGQAGYSASQDVLVINDSAGDTYVALQAPAANLRGTVTLTAAPAQAFTSYNSQGNTPDTVSFEISPAGAGTWTTLATIAEPLDSNGNPVLVNGFVEFATSLDTTTLRDGLYDLRVEAEGSFGVYVGNQVDGVRIDNTPPLVTLANPGAQLSGVTALNASATDSGSGLAAVRFEYSPAGAGQWTAIGVLSTGPFTLSFDTRGLPGGSYDLRVEAVDLAGNVGVSNVIAGVSISNPSPPVNPDSFVITDYVVPATQVTMLGAIAGSADGETWAIGFTTAPPAIVNGVALPYTAPSGTSEPVLLRYLDTTGWQIVDVLRNADGSPYVINPGASITVNGQMTPTGEAWLLVAQAYTMVGQGLVTTAALFHRAPGGLFELDPTSSANLAPMLTQISPGSPPSISLGTASDGTVFGVLVNSSQITKLTPVSVGTTRVFINTALAYGALSGGVWSLQQATLPPSYAPTSNDTVTLQAASPTGPDAGWGVIKLSAGPTAAPLFLAQFDSSGWHYVASVGLDALDLTDNFTPAALGLRLRVIPQAIAATSDGIWISALVPLPGSNGANEVVALYDPASGHVVASWCATAVQALSLGCAQPLDANHPAAVPDATFDTPSGPIALAQGVGAVDVYAYGQWTAVPVSGFGEDTLKPGLFTSSSTGWLAGTYAVGQMTAQTPASPLALWPQANENTLTAVALPPGGASVSTTGALAVGLEGAALHYDASAGWLVDPVPQQARAINLFGVAFDGPGRAFAVGADGTILDWNGSAWSLDPQSSTLTLDQLNAVAFAPDGEGWAVGNSGTVLHFDGTTWSVEQLDQQDTGSDMTSVTVAGSQVFAVAGGELLVRGQDGTWARVNASLLPQAPAPADGVFTLVSGLPDGGLVVAGQSIVLIRETASSAFTYSDQPIDGTAVALAAFRDPSTGHLEAFVSVSPPVRNIAGQVSPSIATPAGDGELLLDTANGWIDLSRSQYPATKGTLEGVPEPNPVLAIAAAPDGTAAWAVGGYAGTETASGQGNSGPLASIPVGWQTASIWRYDRGGSAQAPTVTQATTTLPAQPGTVSFAFFSSPECHDQCAAVAGAQPDANLEGAASEISAFAAQPGGPVFAMLGGNAVGPIIGSSRGSGNGAVDLADLQRYLTPLGSLPLYAAFGPLDFVPTSANPVEPWGNAFAQSPAPFGLGTPSANIIPVSAGGANGSVHLYYSFDVEQNGGTLRVIVLDNAAGSLESSAPAQTAWLEGQLAAADELGLPIVVFSALPLDSAVVGSASDSDAVATMLASAGVLAVFTTSPTLSDVKDMVPYEQIPGPAQIPEFEGASLGYQQNANDGVLWYFASVDTLARSVTVQGIPVVQSLALEPLDGLTAARSSTLLFRAVGRRPAGTLADPGYENYVSIPAPSCGSCVTPSYTFTSSNAGVGDFVVPSGPGSLFPLLNPEGKTAHSSTSGLFCAFNAGTTTVSVTSGLLTSSLTVTVLPGDIGRPCGTVTYAPDETVVVVQRAPAVSTSTAPAPGNAAPAPPATSPAVVSGSLPLVVPPPPPIVPPVSPAPVPPAASPPPPAPLVVVPSPSPSPVPIPTPTLFSPTVVVPPIPPAATPIPPGGATAQAAARREEKARKHARQSAYVIRPAGISALDWFYPALGVAGVLALLLCAAGFARPRRLAEARAQLFDPDHLEQRRRT